MKSITTLIYLVLAGVGDVPFSHALADPATSDTPQSRLLRPAPKRVAIIGAGSAGTSTAYHLAQYTNSTATPPEITIFERSAYIGGRSTTVDAWDTPGVPIELGASIFVSKNTILVDAAAALNLTTAAFSRSAAAARSDAAKQSPPTEELGIWDGRTFVFTMPVGSGPEGRWRRWWGTARLLWRYGLVAPRRTMALMEETVGAFLQLYSAPLFPWRSLSTAVQATGLLRATGTTGSQFLQTNGAGGGKFIWEVVQASTRVNYAQNLDRIHALEALVCMATDGAVSVVGGNWRIFDGMARESGARVRLETSMVGLGQGEGGTWKVRTSNGVQESIEEFDTIVVAAPWQFAGIGIDDTVTASLRLPDEIPYVSLHVTLFASPLRLAPSAFALDAAQLVPDVILTTLPLLEDDDERTPVNGLGPEDFFSISILRTALNPETTPPREEYIYKIFSPRPIEKSFLAKILGIKPPVPHDEETVLSKDEVSWIYRKVWNSYPYLLPRVTFEEMKLDEGLWYTSGIESFISTMETSSLMGKNVARLIADEWEAEGELRPEVELMTEASEPQMQSEL